MNFKDKLSKLLKGRNLSELSRRAGFSSHTAIASVLYRGVIPKGEMALRIARVLEVPVEWLIDDATDWPPPPISGRTPDDMSAWELQWEMLKQFRFRVEKLCLELNEVSAITPEFLVKRLRSIPDDQALPDDLSYLLRLLAHYFEAYHSINDAFMRIAHGHLPFERHEKEKREDWDLFDRLIQANRKFFLTARFGEYRQELIEQCKKRNIGYWPEEPTKVFLINEEEDVNQL